ncbi:GDP-D-glucose phosphorylase 1-like isoform X2 [Argiope bruennichi]|nr:GDP-D-glucose phosphorylase 1-like isoform X2 [Argiope bruennichi]
MDLVKEREMTESSLQFSYSEDDFIFENRCDKNSLFDQYLKTNWETKMNNGCFRYQLRDLETKDLQGKYNFIVQLNIKRAIERRTPQLVSDISMPFDKDKFHFGKVNEKEVLFMIQPQHWFQSKPESNVETYKHALIINVSPLEFGHSLLVPCIDRFCPQVLNFNALRLAVEIMLISFDRDFRLGFNSLGAYASVNHLHFHAYYLKHRLYLESAPVTQLEDRCYILTSFPSEGFAFEVVKKEDILEVVRSVMILIDFLVEKKIPHNIFLTRGNTFCSSKENTGILSVRLYVWAREAYYGTKNDLSFNVAVCELAGHIPIKDERSFESIDEDNIVAQLREACHCTFISIRDKVKQLYN